MEERRTARRFLMNLPVEVTGPAAGGPVAPPAKTRDVSYQGLYFTLDRQVQVGSAIEFVLTLPNEITLSGDVRVRCAGRVVRVEAVSSGEVEKGPEESSRVGVAAVIEQYDFLSPPA
ncbi:MAG: PilZ domain-containing protein [Acidobacteria bacterium]|nr:PilZ domain-containing protein [Acidobacteriota bacterium]